ncbi:MAG: hypothetical protein M3R65_05575, partial [Gemmatimonadota bacterium]|nr:hypothetical protein [Gemmatimonadota bacterium]
KPILSSDMIRFSRRRFARLPSRFSTVAAALLFSVMAFQLVLVGSGSLCLMPHHDGMPSTATSMKMATQITHSFGAAQQAAVRTRTSTRMPADQCDKGDGQRQPPQCATMAACAPSVLPITVAVAAAATRVASRAVPAPVLAALSRTSAPELPPPRA